VTRGWNGGRSGLASTPVTVRGPLAEPVVKAIRRQFEVSTTRDCDDTVVTAEGVDQAAVRALMVLLWDTGHELLAMSTTTAGRRGADGDQPLDRDVRIDGSGC
jgi:hypothetical protein